MACRDGRPLLDRRRGAAARRRSRRARGQRRHAARPRRPQGLRAALGRAPPRRDRQGARDPGRRDRALPRRPRRPRGRAARHVAARARRRRARAASSSASAPSSRSSTPTSGPSSRRSRRASSTSCCTSRPCGVKDAAGTPRGDYYADALAALFDLPSDRGLDACSASRRAAARSRAWQAERVGALLGGEPVEYVLDHDHRRPRPALRPARDRRAPACSRRKCSRRCSTAAPTSRCTRPRISRRRRPPGSCSRRFPNAATRATRSSGATLDGAPDRRRASAPVRCAGGRSSRRSAPTSRSRPLRGNIETRLRKRADEGLRRGRRRGRRARTARPARPRRPRCSTPRVLLPQVAQGALAVECRADDDDDARRARARSTIATRTARSRAERAFLAELGGGCNLPCGALARVDGPTRSCSTRCSRRSTATSCCARASIGADPVDVGADAARDLLDGKGGRGAARDRMRRVTVYLVGAGPGDPGLLTVRGAELLRRADVVVYDRLASPALLELAPRGAELVDVGKAPGRVAMTQDEINALLVARGSAGLRGRAPEGRRPVRVRARRRGGRGVPRRGRRRSRSCPASRARSPRRRTRASR